MDHRPRETMDSIVARSTLVATAGEFVPRSLHNESQYQTSSNVQPISSKSNNGNRHLKYQQNSASQSKSNGTDALQSSSQDGRSWRDNNRSLTEGFHNREVRSHSFLKEKKNYNQDIGRRTSERYQNNYRQKYDGSYQSNTKWENNQSDNTSSFKQRPYVKYNRNDQHNGYNKKNKYRQEESKDQMEILIGQLTRGVLECLVCCEHVKQSDSIWSCQICHHVLHLRCVIKWARASRADKEGWRCPACQHVTTTTPVDYLCFCGKTYEPVWNRSDCPHSCGAVCGKGRIAPCPHRCTLPCHPGPCPPCRLFISRECGCGRESKTAPCADIEPFLCSSTCKKQLNCGVHECPNPCHSGNCSPCEILLKQDCYCGRNTQEVPCSNESVNVILYSCQQPCGKKLNCSNHECTLPCHDGPCPHCSFLPEFVKFCPCGKTLLDDVDAPPRLTCLDPIPTCHDKCEKILSCGGPGCRHYCEEKCHEGSCPTCPKDVLVRCRCGHMNKTILCSNLSTHADDARCEKKCSKRRSCGKHKCREVCCIDLDHICPLPCNRQLSCGSHRCEETCHAAFCKQCPRDSYEELSCECGAQVIFPPVPCGTRPPPCSRPCSRDHPCGHKPTHSCTSDPECPPCTTLVAKYCHGGHELRKAILCHLKSFSCGIACGKPLSCGRHNCSQPCHDGLCLRDGQMCTQKCIVPRSICGHPCGLPCHEPPCLDSPCKEMVKVSCECGERFSTRACIDNARDFNRIATLQLASKMADLAAGQTVDLNEMAISGKKITYKTLECTEECKVIERNRRLAVGLQIRNPDLSAKLTPRFSEFLRSWAKRDASFCQMVHDKLTDLVQLAKQSKQKSRSFSFPSMNSDKRHFVHEYCEHFGCESVAYDKEPNRNIVATALKDKSWLPSFSLLEIIQRENGGRKIPLPSNSKSKLVPSLRAMEVLSTKPSGRSAWGVSATATPNNFSPSTNNPSNYSDELSTSSSSRPEVDYFDMTPLQ